MQDTYVEDISQGSHENHLLKVLGVTFGIAVTIGGMIGLGILRAPGLVAEHLGSFWPVMLVWALGGAYALFGTFQAAELAASIPKAGGWYAFSQRAFGDYAGFLVGWMDWINYPVGLAMGAVVAAEYFSSLFPTAPVKLTAAAILLGLLVLNLRGVRSGSRVQEITSFGKAIILFLLIGACFWVGGGVDAGDVPAASTARPTLLGAVIALQAVIYAYDGWYAACYFSEECRDPGEKIPRAMIAAVVAVTFIYLLVNAAIFYVLPLERIAASDLPVGEAADAIFGSSGKVFITILAIVSIISLLNSNLMTGPRIIFAMARDGLFFRQAATVNAGGTPGRALVITGGLALPFVFLGTFESLLAILAFMFILLYLAGFAALIALRRREPGLERPYRAWGYPWTTLIVIVGSLAFLIAGIASDSLNAVYTAGLILLSYPAYLYVRRLSRATASP